ncbi:MAG: hypothetical protein GX604_05105 [Actinobacteria bacterium]|nr:hypothetical protein [Actinomycetota bacterium]
MKPRFFLLIAMVSMLLFLVPPAHAQALVRVENPWEGLKGCKAYVYGQYLVGYNGYFLSISPQINAGRVKMVNKAGANRGLRWGVQVENYIEGAFAYYRWAVTYSDAPMQYDDILITNGVVNHEMKIAQSSEDSNRWHIYVDGTPMVYNLYWYTDYRTAAGTESESGIGEDDCMFTTIACFTPSRTWLSQTSEYYGDCYDMSDSLYQAVIPTPFVTWYGDIFAE